MRFQTGFVPDLIDERKTDAYRHHCENLLARAQSPLGIVSWSDESASSEVEVGLGRCSRGASHRRRASYERNESAVRAAARSHPAQPQLLKSTGAFAAFIERQTTSCSVAKPATSTPA